MNRLKRIVHRRRSSNGDSSVVTLAVPKDELKVLAPDQQLAPQKSGILLKFTNLLKRWKPRFFILENGVLLYGAPSGEDDIDNNDDQNRLPDREAASARRKKSKKRRILRRITSRDEKERDIKGSINLQFAVISADESDDCRFAIDVGHEIYHCKAETRTERDQWVEALTTSNQYFKNLIDRAVSRAKESISEKNRPLKQSPPHPQPYVAAVNKKPSTGTTIGDASDESDDSFLEDDGLKEAEKSRKTLMAELRRVLDTWRNQWANNSKQSITDQQLLNTLSNTFNDLKKPSKHSNNLPQDIAKGLIDLTAWCLHVLQTNDDMFDRRLKADLTRMMAGGLPVFPNRSNEQLTPFPSTSSAQQEEESDDEFFDALSRAASVRSSMSRVDWKDRNSALAMLVSADDFKQEQETELRRRNISSVERVSTKVIARNYKGSRTALPPLTGPKEKLNVFNLLKDSVGKDLSKISMPVVLNEPLSFIQRLAEDIEYSPLLDQGAEESDQDRRMMYVAAMVISHYSSTQGRISKPFNPLLGETACVIRPDKGKGVRYMAEQVSHHPPISACYAEGSKDSWKYYNSLEVKNKFWGKSLEVFPTGLNHVEFPKHGDHFVFEQITSCVHNIVIGRMWLDNYGEMEIVNRTNGGRCEITFSKTGWMSDTKSFGAIKATIFDKQGKAKIKLGGNWTDAVYEILPKGKNNLIWSVEERPSQDASQNYNMTKWAITLNPDVTAEERAFLPPTDSRLRPDQRALERGQFDLGNKYKNELEEGQRARRRLMEEAGEHWEPRWFKRTKDEDTGYTEYRFTGDFFQKHAEGDWSTSPDIFSCTSATEGSQISR